MCVCVCVCAYVCVCLRGYVWVSRHSVYFDKVSATCVCSLRNEKTLEILSRRLGSERSITHRHTRAHTGTQVHKQVHTQARSREHKLFKVGVQMGIYSSGCPALNSFT